MLVAGFCCENRPIFNCDNADYQEVKNRMGNKKREDWKRHDVVVTKKFDRWLNRQVMRSAHGLPVEEYEDDNPPKCPLCNGTKVYKDDAPCPHCRGKGHCWTFLE